MLLTRTMSASSLIAGAATLVLVLGCTAHSATVGERSASAPIGTATTTQSDLRIITSMFPGTYPYEITESYKWISVGRVYSVAAKELGRRLVVVGTIDDQPPVCLTCAPDRLVGDFLALQFRTRFPSDNELVDIAEFLTRLRIGYNAPIADAEFLKKEGPHFQNWLRGRRTDPKVLEALCTGVEVKKTQDSWRLRFKVITHQGGVKEITATGHIVPLTIEEIAIERIFDDGEFSNLLEG